MRTALSTACGIAGGGAGILKYRTGRMDFCRKQQDSVMLVRCMTGAIGKGNPVPFSQPEIQRILPVLYGADHAKLQ